MLCMDCGSEILGDHAKILAFEDGFTIVCNRCLEEYISTFGTANLEIINYSEENIWNLIQTANRIIATWKTRHKNCINQLKKGGMYIEGIPNYI